MFRMLRSVLSCGFTFLFVLACGEGSVAPDGGEDPGEIHASRVQESAGSAGDTAAVVSERAVTAGGDAILDVEIELPNAILLEGGSHAAPSWSSLTLRALLSAVEEYATEMAALDPSTASEAQLESAAADALRLQLTLTGVASVLAAETPAAGGGTPPAEGELSLLKQGGVLGAIGSASTSVGDIKCALGNGEYFAFDPDAALGKCDIISGVNTSLAAEIGLRTMIEVMLNRVAWGATRIQEVDGIAQAMADQAASDGENDVAAAVEDYRAALDFESYFQRSATLEGGVLTFLNGTLPTATATLIDELWAKLAALDPNSPPTLHQELANLTTELRESAILGSYQATSSSATGFAGVADDAFAYLAPMPEVGDDLEARKPDIDATLAAIAPSAGLSDAAADLNAAHDALTADLARLDEDLAREQEFVLPLTGRLADGYGQAEDGAKAVTGSPSEE